MFQRYFHVGKATMNVTKTSVLAKLRKSTGYPLSNCKKALEMYPDDIAKAEEWLHAEAKSKGWSKWAKIQTRTATQGLIGVCSRDNVGVMVEINCETDFVSRNAEFQQFVEKMLSGCVNFAKNLTLEKDVTKVVLDESQLGAVQCETETLGELVVAATMKFNEKTVAKRAVFLKVENEILLNSLSHPAILCSDLNGASLGKYGVLLAAKEEETDVPENTAALKQSICQHIIGMNPLTIGELTDKDIAKFLAKNNPVEDSQNPESVESISGTENTQGEHDSKDAQVEQSVQSEDVSVDEDSKTEGQEVMESELKETNETQLLFQPYLMAPEATVGETLFKSGVKVLAFERFECGETAEESSKEAVSASA